mgnify:CR=1 FL=1
MQDHPCNGCQAVPKDHAILCPVLGVIASGRHKKIRAMQVEKAFEKLHGWAAIGNNRVVIRLRSLYWRESYLAKYTGLRAYAGGTVTLRRKVGAKRAAPGARLSAATGSLGSLTPAPEATGQEARVLTALYNKKSTLGAARKRSEIAVL